MAERAQQMKDRKLGNSVTSIHFGFDKPACFISVASATVSRLMVSIPTRFTSPLLEQIPSSIETRSRGWRAGTALAPPPTNSRRSSRAQTFQLATADIGVLRERAHSWTPEESILRATEASSHQSDSMLRGFFNSHCSLVPDTQGSLDAKLAKQIKTSSIYFGAHSENEYATSSQGMQVRR